jgi:hypothetical protein
MLSGDFPSLTLADVGWFSEANEVVFAHTLQDHKHSGAIAGIGQYEASGRTGGSDLVRPSLGVGAKIRIVPLILIERVCTLL